MVAVNYLPRVRIVIGLGCVFILCILSWDVILLHRLNNNRLFSMSGLRDNSSLGWSWECAKGSDGIEMCIKRTKDLHSASAMTLASCRMICSPGINIWPFPTGEVKVANTTASFHSRQFKVYFEPVNNLDLSILLKKATKLYQERIVNLARKSHAYATVKMVNIIIKVKPKKGKIVFVDINADESYKLIVSQKDLIVNATILASSFRGAHHGLETLTQLIWWDERDQLLKIMDNVVISDAPIFTYRGLMLDTGNNFVPLPSIYVLLEAMAMTKMNVFHWHLTDSKSFPFVSKQVPMFSGSGAFSTKETYTVEEVQEVVEFAEVRGIMVLIEIDAPSHNSQGWDWGDTDGKGNLSLCVNAQPFSEFCAEPPCGQLNPINQNTYSVLIKLITELKEIARSENLLHIGGDATDLRCWENSEEVTESEIYLKKGTIGVWEHFYKTLFDSLEKGNIKVNNIIMWSNDFIEEADMWKKWKHVIPIIQSKGPSNSGELERLVKKKFRVIVSPGDTWDLSEPQTWKNAYYHRPWSDLNQADGRFVIGGEALVFSYLLDHNSLQAAVWPAAAAVAERLWSDPARALNPLDRLAVLRQRMEELGIRSSPVAPQWCLHNPYQCL